MIDVFLDKKGKVISSNDEPDTYHNKVQIDEEFQHLLHKGKTIVISRNSIIKILN